MHYLNQYLSLYGLPSASQTAHPLAQQLHALGTQSQHKFFNLAGAESLERLIMQVSVLSLVLKVIFQDYVLEHLSIKEQLDLFDDGSLDCQLAQSLYLNSKQTKFSDHPPLASAQTSSSSQFMP
jgi:hypothetical protein